MALSFQGQGFLSSESFDRKWAVTVNTTRTTELDFKCKIEKTLKDEPNKCHLEIYNLSEDHRAELEELNPVTSKVSGLEKKKVKIAARQQATRGIPVKIEAGYREDPDLSLLWLGDLRSCKSERQGPDWVTTLESGDGEKAWQNARINVSFGPKTPVDTAMRAIVRALGVGEGNLSTVVAKMKIAGVGRLIPQGTVITGPAGLALRDWAKQSDLEFSVQDGALQFLDAGKAIDQTAFLVSEETGMLGSPTVDIDGLLHVKMLLPHGIRPGRLLVVDAQRIKGNFRAEKITYECDSAGNDWLVDLEAIRF